MLISSHHSLSADEIFNIVYSYGSAATEPARLAGPPIHHYDLYRLTGGGDMGRLSLDSALSNAVCLIEWAERLQVRV